MDGYQINMSFCIEAIREYGFSSIIHTNNGKQFMSNELIKLFRDRFDTLGELKEATKNWISYYNKRRYH